MTTLRNYIFYKFTCLNDDVDSCYVGSTGNFKKRRADHKTACTNENNKSYKDKIYQTIRENGGWDNWKMVQIGSRDQITKREAEQIEEEYRKQLKTDMNTNRAFITGEERKEYEREYKKEYYENNKEIILEQMKEYRKNNKDKLNEKVECECGNIVSRKHLSTHKKTMIHNLKLLEIGETSE